MGVSEAKPAAHEGRPGLRREVGFIGLIWASEGSIIGSGWLFGAQKALGIAGPAAIIAWGIGGTALLSLALVHDELGGMYPVSGGTARFPHYAFGGAAGASFGWFSWLQAARVAPSAGAAFGWFSWLQAATVAPIEVSAMLTYMGHYSWGDDLINPENAVLTHSGI